MSFDTIPAPDPTSARTLRALFRKYDFHPRRSLGQTFLIDANIARRLVMAADLTGVEPVLEIGAGAGALTRLLALKAARLLAVEIEPKLVAVLAETVGEGAEVRVADVLKMKWEELLGAEKELRWRVMANLPYAITGPAVLRLLEAEARSRVDHMVIMVQEEVAQRLVASPGGRARGKLSVLLQTLCEAEILWRVSRNCFWPRPRVDSAVVMLKVRRPPLLSSELEEAFRRLVWAAFLTRRKTVANALCQAPALSLEKSQVESLLAKAGIDGEQRAEMMTEEQFLRFAEEFASWEERRKR